MTRSEHLQWCKDRALEYVEQGDLVLAWSSFRSDMSKHLETENHGALPLGDQLLFNDHLDTSEKMRKHIEGYN